MKTVLQEIIDYLNKEILTSWKENEDLLNTRGSGYIFSTNTDKRLYWANAGRIQAFKIALELLEKFE